MRKIARWAFCVILLTAGCSGPADNEDILGIARLGRGPIQNQNALWIENDPSLQFTTTKRVVVADLKGPGVITMMHFAVSATIGLFPPPGTHPTINRDLLLKIYWDGEATPSLDCPLVDFFCDPAGTQNIVNTAYLNKCRGFNCYFPMPFRKSARVELVYDGPLPAGRDLSFAMPCYSYVMARPLSGIPDDVGYFHASWRQEGVLLGQQPYLVLDATGHGKFIGWNVTARKPGRPGGCPVDENVNIYVDGEAKPSVELQGLEDSFGFSWGFPPGGPNAFPLTGYAPFFGGEGATAYRFFVPDAVPFEKSLRVTVAFGPKDDPSFAINYSKKGSELQFSSVAYWYQTEPHTPLPGMPPAADRAPAPSNPTWPVPENLPSPETLRSKGVRLHMRCGRPLNEVIFAEPGYSAQVLKGFAYDQFPSEVYHCRADAEEVQIQLAVPKGKAGTVRLFLIDPDNFWGGRHESVVVAGQRAGPFENFQSGRWVEVPVPAERTTEGTILVKVVNDRPAPLNAVVSMLEWVETKE